MSNIFVILRLCLKFNKRRCINVTAAQDSLRKH